MGEGIGVKSEVFYRRQKFLEYKWVVFGTMALLVSYKIARKQSGFD